MPNPDLLIFDYGCGEGSILQNIAEHFRINHKQLTGCDTSRKAIEIAAAHLDGVELHSCVFPKLKKKQNIIICSDVIEHTQDYLDILHWITENLAEGGKLILTTQSGKIHESDTYTGHTQHFDIKYLNRSIRQFGLEV